MKRKPEIVRNNHIFQMLSIYHSHVPLHTYTQLSDLVMARLCDA